MPAAAVLIVDDDPSTLHLLAFALRGTGYRILEAADPGEALAASNSYSGPIPLLVTDIAMPRMNGLKLAQRILGHRPQTKVIYITAYSEIFEVDPSTLLRKPFTPEQLVSKV